MTEAQQQYSEIDQGDDTDPLIGTMIGERYRLEAVLGTGGMGTVYLAEHVLMEKKVALKILHPTLAVVSSVMERFQHEAVALARIDHPNVVNATDFGKLDNGAYYLALQYVEGRDLAQVLAASTQPFEPLRAATIALQVASALDAAHSQGIVHRDLKPHNIMLARTAEGDEQAKVLDFGLAKLRSKSSEGRPVTEGSVFGTPHYISPEQVTGGDVDGRADLYCLGLILYEMLAGKRAYDGRDVKDVLRRQVTEQPEPLEPQVPEVLRELVAQLLNKEREGRPPSASVVATILEQMLAPPRESMIPPWLERSVSVGRFKAPTWALVLPAVTFILIFTVGLILSGGDERPAPVITVAEPAIAAEPTTQPPDIPEPDRWLELMSAAEFGEEPALQELLKIPPAERKPDLWLTLGAGYMKSQRTDEALDIYQEAIAHLPELADNIKIAENVQLAVKDMKTMKKAIAVAAESMGERGVNILFHTWAGTAKRTPASALAERYLKSERVQKKASKAVTLALALRKSHSCNELRTLLEQAKEYGDTRSLNPMAKLRNKRGCGASKKDDCFGCLRNDSLLEDAIAAAAERLGPKH